MKCLLAILIVLMAAVASGQTTHYANISAVSNGDGTSGSPWKTMDNVVSGLDALGDDGAGDTVIFAAGNYGRLDQAFWKTAKADWITLQAAADSICILDNESEENYAVLLNPGSLTNIYLKIDGWLIMGKDPNPLPADDGSTRYNTSGGLEKQIVGVVNANYFHLLNCEVRAETYRWLWKKAVVIGMSHNVLVQGCRVHRVSHYGINWYGDSAEDQAVDISIVGNIIEDIPMGGLLVTGAHSAGRVLAVRNHLRDCYSPYLGTGIVVKEPFCPYNQRDNVDYHQSSAINVRARPVNDNSGGPSWDEWVLRQNVVHSVTKTGGNDRSGSSQGLYFYDFCGYYDAVTVESNWFLPNPGAFRFENLRASEARPVVFRNNTWSGSRGSGTNPGIRTHVVAWWSGSPVTKLHSTAADASYIYFQNNIVRGQFGGTFITLATLTGGNNLYWCPSSSQYQPGWKTATDISAVWQDPDDDLRGNPNFFDSIGFTGTTDDYTYATHGIPDFFENAAISDFRLAGNSVYMGAWIDPETHGDPDTDSSYSLGSFDADGFIQDDGTARDADHHSVGAYEAGASFGHPVRPVLPFPYNMQYGVDVELALSWSAGLGAVTYNVYVGTNKALVDARDAGTLKSSEQSDLTYTHSTDWTGETTYYWAVDSVGADDAVGNGVTWQFTTAEGEEPPPEPTDPPSAPINLSPANGAVRQAITVSMTWQDGGDADTYDVFFSTSQVDVESLLADVRVLTDTADLTYDPASDLEYATTYYWRVRAKNDGGWTNTSTISFTTASAEVPPGDGSYFMIRRATP